MTKRGSLGTDLLREVWKRSVPQVRMYRVPTLPGRIAWMLPFLRERIPQRWLPESLQQEAEQRLRRRVGLEEAKAEAEAITTTSEPIGYVLPPHDFQLPPPLADKTELQGRKGRYQIHRVQEQRGIGQIYQAEQILEDRPVVIKEYWLPEHRFSIADIRQRLGAFDRLAGVSLADGRVQDVRLIGPWDAMADVRSHRCYLILPGQLGALPTLRSHLAHFGLMGEAQVRLLLNQVLQTLECLHGQRYRLPSGQVTVGLAHGNLSLDSLLMSGQGSQFFIYLCDLALWEHLFDPEGLISTNPQPADDLVALGKTAAQLLFGQDADQALVTASFQAAPQATRPSHTLEISPAFRAFLQRLIGATVPFENATAARQALLHLPVSMPVSAQVRTVVQDTEVPTKRRRARWWLLGLVLGMLLLTGLIGWWRLRSRPAVALGDPMVCCLADVASIPQQKSTYTAVSGSSWDYIWQQPGLLAQNRTLEEILRQKQPKFKLTYRPVPYVTEDAAAAAVIERVQQGQADFAISSLSVNDAPELAAQTIAYDGLAAFVVFSYNRRDQSLPTALSGQITFAQLRRLYLEDIPTWKALDPKLPDLPVRLYAPQDPEVLHIFEQRVLQTPSAIATFRRRFENKDALTSPASSIKLLPTFPLLRAVIQDFEDQNVGAIAFGPLSQVYGQCAVYPLALVEDAAKAVPIQPLVQENNAPITPLTNLCDDKGSYFPNIQAFRTGTYPLAYPLSVVYRRDNSQPPFGRKFAELLQTQEGQRFLGTAGLVPLQPLKSAL